MSKLLRPRVLPLPEEPPAPPLGLRAGLELGLGLRRRLRRGDADALRRARRSRRGPLLGSGFEDLGLLGDGDRCDARREPLPFAPRPASDVLGFMAGFGSGSGSDGGGGGSGGDSTDAASSASAAAGRPWQSTYARAASAPTAAGCTLIRPLPCFGSPPGPLVASRAAAAPGSIAAAAASALRASARRSATGTPAWRPAPALLCPKGFPDPCSGLGFPGSLPFAPAGGAPCSGPWPVPCAAAPAGSPEARVEPGLALGFAAGAPRRRKPCRSSAYSSVCAASPAAAAASWPSAGAPSASPDPRPVPDPDPAAPLPPGVHASSRASSAAAPGAGGAGCGPGWGLGSVASRPPVTVPGGVPVARSQRAMDSTTALRAAAVPGGSAAALGGPSCAARQPGSSVTDT